jgi:ribonucleoside-diphosphate reductase alpha chain
MNNKYVTKLNGSTEDFDITKVRKVIEWAVSGSKINPLELESQIDIVFYNGIKTQDIQENLISHALSLVDIDNQDYLNIAANLRVMTRYKIYRDINFKEFALNKVNSKEYSDQLTIYSNNELDLAGSWIDKERDKIYDYAGANIILSKFLYKDEPIQYSCLASALVIASKESKENRITFAKDLYDAFSLKKISLASPLLGGVRKGKHNLASCFIGLMGDDLDDIYYTLHKAAKISKNGGGLGLYIGDIRCNGSWVKNTPNASGGITGWIKLINDTAVTVNQCGRRAGAITVALPIYHYDIEEFLSLQTEHGDQRKKSFDILPQLLMYDLFFEQYEAKGYWYCFDPYELRTKLSINLSDYISKDSWEMRYKKCISEYETGSLKLVKKYEAKYIMRKLIETITETGMPYLAYIDTINKYNPNKHIGSILCVNLCCESYSITNTQYWHTCSLSSLNLAYIEPDEIEKYSRLITRMLDIVLDLCEYPIEESKNHVDAYRTIGVGILGLADYLVKTGYSYETAYKNKKLLEIFENIAYHCIDESINLAEQKGMYPKFTGSTWNTGEQIKYFKSNSFDPDRWNIIQSKINIFGIRNSQLLSPAPNTTSGLIQGSVACILPPFNLLHYDDSSNGSIAVMPTYLSKYPLRYKAYRNYDMLNMIDYVSEMQKFIDTGISFEALFDLTKEDENGRPIITATYIRDFIIKSWKSGIKANYYFRYVTKDNKITAKEECIGCTG